MIDFGDPIPLQVPVKGSLSVEFRGDRHPYRPRFRRWWNLWGWRARENQGRVVRAYHTIEMPFAGVGTVHASYLKDENWIEIEPANAVDWNDLPKIVAVSEERSIPATRVGTPPPDGYNYSSRIKVSRLVAWRVTKTEIIEQEGRRLRRLYGDVWQDDGPVEPYAWWMEE